MLEIQKKAFENAVRILRALKVPFIILSDEGEPIVEGDPGLFSRFVPQIAVNDSSKRRERAKLRKELREKAVAFVMEQLNKLSPGDVTSLEVCEGYEIGHFQALIANVARNMWNGNGRGDAYMTARKGQCVEVLRIR